MTEQQHSEQWSKAHLAATDLLNELLHVVRDHGYNPSHHISYDGHEHHILMDDELVKNHKAIADAYEKYKEACAKREDELEQVQELPKVDLGF